MNKLLIIYLPLDVLNLIFQYDGRIKYLPKKQLFINIISKNDDRYTILDTKIKKKINLIEHFHFGNAEKKFYIDIYYKNKELGLLFCKKLL